MLVEVPHPRQIPGEGHRRWFADRYFDLIVWYAAPGGEVTGFQLCYDKPGSQRALTWKASRGYRHERVDDGETPGGFKMSPVLVPDGVLDTESLVRRFRSAAERIDAQVRDLVLGRLESYGRTGGSAGGSAGRSAGRA